MGKREVVSISLNEEEMKMFNELKDYIFEVYYKDNFQYKKLSDFPNSILLKHLIHHEYYMQIKDKE